MTIEFGAWRLVPINVLPGTGLWRLHRSYWDDDGKLRWHEVGGMYREDELADALRFAAFWELKLGNHGAVVSAEALLDKWQTILDGFLADLLVVEGRLHGKD